MKNVITLIGLGLTLGLFFILNSKTPIAFESLESKTENGLSVFNRIKYLPGWDQDIWLMQQSHSGYQLEFSEWDKLAIVVDKTKSPTTATFYQLSKGELDFSGATIPNKARCFACHANGPRAIRANDLSAVVTTNFFQKVQIAFWNLRIKTYGKINSFSSQDFEEGVPFKSKSENLSQKFDLPTCIKCHSNSGIRSELKLEHLGTIRFLVKNGYMPPLPFSLTPAERLKLFK